jgi:hypothetical protein
MTVVASTAAMPNEFVISEFLPRWPLIGIVGQTVIYEANALSTHADIRGQSKCRLLLPFELIFVLRLLKGRVTGYHFEQDCPERPNVRLVIIYTPVENFRGHIDWGATVGCVEIVVHILQNLRKTEVSYLDKKRLLRQQLRLREPNIEIFLLLFLRQLCIKRRSLSSHLLFL